MPLSPEEKRRRAKDSRLRSRYGVSLEQFELVLEAQGGICPVCKRSDKIFCLDHNHKTLKWRGVVCLNCNLRVIGGARDDDEKIINAAQYIISNPTDLVFPEGFYLAKNPPKTRRRKRVKRVIKRPRP